MIDAPFCLTALEKRAYAEDGFFIREGILGEDEIDHRVDIWSMGVTLYSALTATPRTRATRRRPCPTRWSR